MHMLEVGYNWGEKYNSQLKIIDVRWVTNKYRGPPYKTRSPGPPGACLGTCQCGNHSTSECTAVRGE
jgi:hypothetical protein